jgi:hypothetical protein
MKTLWNKEYNKYAKLDGWQMIFENDKWKIKKYGDIFKTDDEAIQFVNEQYQILKQDDDSANMYNMFLFNKPNQVNEFNIPKLALELSENLPIDF